MALQSRMTSAQVAKILERETGLVPTLLGVSESTHLFDCRTDWADPVAPPVDWLVPSEYWLLSSPRWVMESPETKQIQDILLVDQTMIGSGRRIITAIPLIGEIEPFKAGLLRKEEDTQ